MDYASFQNQVLLPGGKEMFKQQCMTRLHVERRSFKVDSEAIKAIDRCHQGLVELKLYLEVVLGLKFVNKVIVEFSSLPALLLVTHLRTRCFFKDNKAAQKAKYEQTVQRFLKDC